MTAWEIDDTGAYGLIAETRGILDQLDGIETDLADAVVALEAALANGTVNGALDDCHTQFIRPMAASAHLAGNQICTKTEEAVNAYVEGDTTMAAAAQSRIDDLPEYTETTTTVEAS